MTNKTKEQIGGVVDRLTIQEEEEEEEGHNRPHREREGEKETGQVVLFARVLSKVYADERAAGELIFESFVRCVFDTVADITIH